MARSRGRRADYQWQGNVLQLAGVGAAGSFTGIQVNNTAGATIVRCRGEILCGLDVGAAGDGAVVGHGLMVMDDDQLAVGLTGMPDPEADLDADWIWHGFSPLRSESGTQGQDHGDQHRLTIDSKAMRRIKQNDNLVYVIGVSILSGTPTVDVTLGVRMLIAS